MKKLLILFLLLLPNCLFAASCPTINNVLYRMGADGITSLHSGAANFSSVDILNLKDFKQGRVYIIADPKSPQSCQAPINSAFLTNPKMTADNKCVYEAPSGCLFNIVGEGQDTSCNCGDHAKKITLQCTGRACMNYAD